jgi:hypothetical protein
MAHTDLSAAVARTMPVLNESKFIPEVDTIYKLVHDIQTVI